MGLLFSAAVFLSYEKSAFFGRPGVSVDFEPWLNGWFVFHVSLLLSMIFTKKIASSPLVI